VRRQKGYLGSYSGVVAMLVKKNMSALQPIKIGSLIFFLAKSCIVCNRFIGIK
jgi:hypothetical protein